MTVTPEVVGQVKDAIQQERLLETATMLVPAQNTTKEAW